ncbi:hypothetical protein HYFRA_00011876 [Hymenoscyphus fraxineus]|uniref:Zn(2)-C6 fungal-type domain-containing protein n=1 Tax=Hymenoscyphus fraxineus TaxID=746836 RepID=A0A9N9PW01_9HELO|nr:hypothetical protein HYFRA_00011876 [Hymenoscyphus fraxineus]
MWELSTTYTTPETNEISNSMGHSYFEPPQNLIPSYPHLPLDSVLSPSGEPPALTNVQRLGFSNSSKLAKIKRSMSTPNVRGQATADAAALALSADKRRNKLGYHRTSVACGHCRRRKIRCIPAPADPQSRCSNCIRLKKECNFYPVDQQPPSQPQLDTRRGDSKSHSGTGRASESSSPTTSTGQLPEIQSNLPYPHMPVIQNVPSPQMKRQRTESYSPESKGVLSVNSATNDYPDKVAVVTSARSFDYNNHGATNWMAPDASPGIKNPGDVSQQYWRANAQDSPLTPAFSPFTPNLQIPPPQNWPTPHTEPSPREDMSWPVPQRSMSYNNLDGLQNHQQNYAPYSQAPPDHYTAKPRSQQLPAMYPPPLSASSMMAQNTSPTTTDPLPHPHSTGSLPPAPYGSWQQPYYPKSIGSTGEDNYHGWNTNQGLPRPAQYSGSTHASAPAPAYYAEPQSGVYYAPHQGHSGR